ncbi:MAG: nitroreductase family protein [Clostridiales bacterium]|nr:nitroreductase family protein [Clostridiales bacterium]
MKRITALFIVLGLALSQAACGSSDTSAEAETDAAEVSETAEAENNTENGTDSAETSETSDVSGALDIVTDSVTTQAFTDEAVAEEDIETILTAGINSPSSMNSQPWHFTALTNSEIISEISEAMRANMPAGANTALAKADIGSAPLVILISEAEGNDFNIGLACQSMALTANVLGYGTKILTSPCSLINSDYREALDIPEDMECGAVLIIGKEDTSLSADEVTAPTERNSFDDVVSYVK